MRKTYTALALPIISLSVFALSACATTPNASVDNSDVGKAVIKEMAAKEGAMTWTFTDKLGNQKEVVMLPVFDFQTEVTRIGSKDAKACQQFASYSKPQETWLAVCDAALADPLLSVDNRIATDFNRALIAFGLGRLDAADAVFKRLAAENPDFAEPLAERAKIARLQYDYAASARYAQDALDRGLEKPYRAHLLMAKAHEGNFDFDAARAAYQMAYDLAPTNSHVRRNYERFMALRPTGRTASNGTQPDPRVQP